MNKVLLVVFCLISGVAYAQKVQPDFHHVEPSFWWLGMKNSSVQILFHNKNLNVGSYQASVKYDGVILKESKKVENPHFLFLTLEISSTAKAGKVPVLFTDGKKSFTHYYELKNKSTDKNRVMGFNSSDVIYLIMPDRFANGDVKNDSIPGMLEATHRNMPYGRHGGDLKGISDHLNYLNNFGVTALWLNPVLENDQKTASYHGYAITDLYKVDRRFGTNEDYVDFIAKSHQLGMKVIQDMVFNHIGNDHWLMHDIPERDWIHVFPEFTRSNYSAPIISDPYQAKDDAVMMSDGWFDTTMPDLNQKNALLANYLIQNTLWWIEYAGIDGIRMDTYPYPDKDFMARWAKEVITEYPTFNIVGEVWMNSTAAVAYWQKGATNNDGYQSNLPSVTDFPFYGAVPQALGDQARGNSGMGRLYNLLNQDFLYPNANGNVTFLDNHDVTRFYTSIGKNLNKFKMGMAFLLTTRGIPQLYYGTELLMEGNGNNHSELRSDFPGGWLGDTKNAFTKEGRTSEQNEAYDYMRTLLNWRKNEPVIHTGKLTHYSVRDNMYVYFRYTNEKSIMVIMNGNTTEKVLNTKRFAENLKDAKKGMNVLTKETISDLTDLHVPAQSALIIALE
jgi:glycosidase